MRRTDFWLPSSPSTRERNIVFLVVLAFWEDDAVDIQNRLLIKPKSHELFSALCGWLVLDRVACYISYSVLPKLFCNTCVTGLNMFIIPLKDHNPNSHNVNVLSLTRKESVVLIQHKFSKLVFRVTDETFLPFLCPSDFIKTQYSIRIAGREIL